MYQALMTKTIRRESSLEKGCHLSNHNLINNARLNLKLYRFPLRRQLKQAIRFDDR
jgi:hypothetical protein